jgi:hypothetical protein
MKVSIALIVFSTLFLIGCSSTRKPPASASPAPVSATGSYPNLTARAKELEDAVARKDAAKMIDLTYPKLIEAVGGRDKMLAATAAQFQELDAEHVQIISSTCETPTQFVTDANGIYAVIPVKSKVRAGLGVFQNEGTLVGVSTDGGQTWTFVDAAGKDENELKKVLPNLDKLNLPPLKPPVKISD